MTDEHPDPALVEGTPTLASDLIERYHQLALKTQNPIYAWMALEVHAHSLGNPQAPDKRQDLMVPAWIADYLLQATQLILLLSGGSNPRVKAQVRAPEHGETLADYFASPDWQSARDARHISHIAAMKHVPFALGLTQGSWNAFSALEAASAKMAEFRLYERHRAAGLTSKQALHAMSTEHRALSERQIARRIQEGRDLIAIEDMSKAGG